MAALAYAVCMPDYRVAVLLRNVADQRPRQRLRSRCYDPLAAAVPNLRQGVRAISSLPTASCPASVDRSSAQQQDRAFRRTAQDCRATLDRQARLRVQSIPYAGPPVAEPDEHLGARQVRPDEILLIHHGWEVGDGVR